MSEIIKEARMKYLCTHESYRRGNVWSKHGGNYANLVDIINNVNTPELVYQTLRKYDMYNITIRSQRKFDLMMEWNRKLLGVNSDPEMVDTPNAYKMFFYCKEINAKCNDVKRIVELGGGNGQFAVMAKHYIENSVHIDIDLPESLYMAYVCTRLKFPEAKCLWVIDETDIDIDAYDFIFVPVQKEGVLAGKNFDLFANTASMGEMSNDNIMHWMDFTQNNINLRYFFGFNRFLNTIPRDTKDSWYNIRKNENEASVLFDSKWNVLRWEVEPDFARCPYEDPRIARYLMIIAERSLSSAPKIDRDEIIEQDWWCYRDVGPLATHRDNQLVHDFTITGTLFRIWNALRYHPDDRELNEMMIAYLEWLSKDKTMFEETLYYQRKIK